MLSVGGCWSTTLPVQGGGRGREPPQCHHTQRRLSVSASMHRVEELWRWGERKRMTWIVHYLIYNIVYTHVLNTILMVYVSVASGTRYSVLDTDWTYLLTKCAQCTFQVIDSIRSCGQFSPAAGWPCFKWGRTVSCSIHHMALSPLTLTKMGAWSVRRGRQ